MLEFVIRQASKTHVSSNIIYSEISVIYVEFYSFLEMLLV